MDSVRVGYGSRGKCIGRDDHGFIFWVCVDQWLEWLFESSFYSPEGYYMVRVWFLWLIYIVILTHNHYHKTQNKDCDTC